jgi:hypothetical protein
VSEPLNGAAVPIQEMAAMTLGELFALTVGDLVGELKSKDVAEEVLLLEAGLAGSNNMGDMRVCVVVTIDHRGDKYIEAVKTRMRKEAERRHEAEVMNAARS